MTPDEFNALYLQLLHGNITGIARKILIREVVTYQQAHVLALDTNARRITSALLAKIKATL